MMFWSHAGRQFSLDSAGTWLSDAKVAEASGIEWADRRQELVFIGLEHEIRPEAISAALDACLLCDSEWAAFAR